jgi:hypothetical protein
MFLIMIHDIVIILIIRKTISIFAHACAKFHRSETCAYTTRMRSWTTKEFWSRAQCYRAMTVKAMAERQLHVYGGYDYHFVDKISDRFICQICTKVLREPHLAVCCGQHFCESCLNKWFTGQGKQSCPHCRAEGKRFNHVIHKGLRSEVNQLKIKCSNHGEGCQWTGELGTLKWHLKSDNGYDLVMVAKSAPINVWILMPTLMSGWDLAVKTMRRRDLADHLVQSCCLRPYHCEFCGLKDTYKAITGNGQYVTRPIKSNEDDYLSHQADCPEVPLTCPNKCGMEKIKRL